MPERTAVRPRWLFFDVFGTVVDWRGSIVRAGERLTERYGIKADWPAVAVAWARKYAEAVRRNQPWQPLDNILWEAGGELLREFAIDMPDGHERHLWRIAWDRLSPWPDSVAGLRALNASFYTSPLSNANRRMIGSLSDSAGLEWTSLWGSDAAAAFKPAPRVYLTALEAYGRKPADCMMVAAHLFDLRAAKELGMQTAFIRRPGEEKGDPAAAPYVDVIADDLLDLNAKLTGERCTTTD